MSQENGGSDPLIRRLGERWLPIESIAYWREFQRRFPVAAAGLLEYTRKAVFGDAE